MFDDDSTVDISSSADVVVSVDPVGSYCELRTTGDGERVVGAV